MSLLAILWYNRQCDGVDMAINITDGAQVPCDSVLYIGKFLRRKILAVFTHGRRAIFFATFYFCC